MRVTLAIDHSGRSANIVREVARHGWPDGTLVRVIAAAPRTPPSAAELWFDADGDLDTAWKARRQRASELATNAAEELVAADLSAEAVVVDSLSRRSLRTQSAEWSADRVIIGWRGHGLCNGTRARRASA